MSVGFSFKLEIFMNNKSVPRFADESDFQGRGWCNEAWPRFLTDTSLMA